MAQDIFATIERLELGEWVKHAGFIPTADLPFWYNCAEAFLFPSVYEGFGLPVLEAMACGTPVITAKSSSLPEVAGGAAKCLPPDDIELWTGALRDLKRDGEWRDLARARGLERAQQFSWARTAELTLKSYRKATVARDLPLGENEKVTPVETK